MNGQMMIVKNETYLAKTGGGTIAGLHEVHLLAEGAVAIFTEDDLMVPAAPSTSFADKAWFRIAVGQTGGIPYFSKPIYRTSLGGVLVRYSASLYDAALDVAEKLWIGDNADNAYDVNLPASLVVGTEATIQITIDDSGFIDTNSTSIYNYTVKTGDAKGDVLTALIAKINADNKATATGVDVTSSNAGIQLVCNTIGVRMHVSCSGILGDTDFVTAYNDNKGATTPPVAPSISPGNAALVARDVADWIAVRGKSNLVTMPADFFTDAMAPEAGVNYDTYVMTTPLPNPKGADPTFLKVYMKDGLTTGTGKTKDALDAIFAAAFAVDTEAGAADEAEA